MLCTVVKCGHRIGSGEVWIGAELVAEKGTDDLLSDNLGKLCLIDGDCAILVEVLAVYRLILAHDRRQLLLVIGDDAVTIEINI